MIARVSTVAFQGVDVLDIDVQVQMASGLPALSLVGLPDKAVAESRERVRAALGAMGLALPSRRITINLAPADVLKEGSHFDLPIALGLLVAMDVLPRDEMAGYSALQLSRDLDVQYKTAFVLAHKLREALASDVNGHKLSGSVEVDGGYFGGYVKPANWKENRRDRRLRFNRSGKRQVVVIMRERNGRSLPFVCKSEDEGIPAIEASVQVGSTVYADDANAWNALHAKYLTKRVNHQHAYSDGEACTNQAESFFSRMRRAEIGQHHHVAGPYLAAYADEMAWREDHRRVSNGELYLLAANAALGHSVSRQWKGYWQRCA